MNGAQRVATICAQKEVRDELRDDSRVMSASALKRTDPR